MSEVEQAIPEEIEIEAVAEVVEGQEVETPETEEVEIVVSGEDKPASKSQVPYGIRKRFNKLNGRIDAAKSEAGEANREAEMLREENKLLRLQAQAGSPTSKPDEDDFETTAEYDAAQDEYDNVRIAKIAQEQAARIIQNNQAQTTQANNDTALEAQLSAHYEKANALKMPNYEELEDKAIDVLGTELSKVIMANTDKSHLIMAHLGANPGKAEELVEMVKTNPVGALVKAVEIGSSLSVKPKNNAPDPETKVEPGAAASDWQSRIDKAREKAVTSNDMTELLSLKKQMREAGVKL